MAQNLKTVLLLGLLTGLLLAIGGFAGGRTGMTVALAVAAVMNLGAWWFSDRLVIAMTRARAVQPGEAPALEAMVRELAQAAGIPAPRLFITPDPSPNAFATGRGPSRSAVAVTQGLLGLLPQREIRGVIAHEIAHIRHRDVLISSVAATVAGAILWLASMARWAMIFGAGRSDDEDRGGGILGMLVLAVLAPLAAMLIQMAVSRSREYAADAEGAAISGDPRALADALEHLHRGIQLRPTVNATAAPVHHIVHPFRGGGLMSLFSTHPPVEERVRRLRALGGARDGGRGR
ncbi:MAG: zinc metalloprotease HtpX [Deltaproteobacteria bacterium]|nr:zinc metalloprotease HtpX [Deltaproteobacteria bacterium]